MRRWIFGEEEDGEGEVVGLRESMAKRGGVASMIGGLSRRRRRRCWRTCSIRTVSRSSPFAPRVGESKKVSVVIIVIFWCGKVLIDKDMGRENATR